MPYKIFHKYADYYDIFYQNKPYRKESLYAVSLFKKYNPAVKSVLDAGCGSGSHACILSQMGYKVEGIDASLAMIKKARAKFKSIPFHCVSIQEFSSNQKYDAVVSLFHVMSYQVNNEQFMLALDNIHKHLKKGGLFIFDFWYGPAVLAELPQRRLAAYKSNGLSISRLSQPRTFLDQNRVEVNYRVDVNAQGKKETIHEQHQLRYFFLPELELMATIKGFKVRAFLDWMSLKSRPSGWCAAAIFEKV